MKSYKEHYPDRTDLFNQDDEAQGQLALCGQKNGILLNLWRDNDLDEEVICKKCRLKACSDCFGTGIVSNYKSESYCSCVYATVAKSINGSFFFGVGINYPSE